MASVEHLEPGKSVGKGARCVSSSVCVSTRCFMTTLDNDMPYRICDVVRDIRI